MERSTNKCFYVVKNIDNPIDVSLGLQFDKNEDDFDDVIFRVINCKSNKRAVERVEKFVRLLAEEFGDRPKGKRTG